MSRYIVRRLMLSIPTIIGVALIIFFVLRLTPGDVADLLLAETPAQFDPVAEQRIREDLGLTGSPVVQFVRWTGNALRGEFGKSYYTQYSVSDNLRQRIPVSMELGLLAMAISVIVGIPVGVIAALRQDSVADYLTRGGVVLFLAMPSFWTAIIVLQLGRVWFQWAPPFRYEDLWVDPVQNLYIMATPALILGINLAAIQARFTRAQLLEVLRQDYIRTARAKGLSGGTVIVKHALRNSLIPVLTVIGLQLAGVVTGTIILEQIFLIPGIGRYLITAATRADYPIVQAVTLLLAVVVISVNLVIDISYGFLDPRVRESYQ